MKKLLCGLLAVSLLGGFDARASAQAPVAEEVPIGFLPVEWVTASLKKTLSPQGRFGFVTPTGPVRISDVAEQVEAARRAIGELQKAPALVPIEISFATTARRTVQRLPAEPPVVDRGIPVPNRYDPPKIIAGPGGMIVVPSQPRDFRTRRVGPGTVVNPSPTGYTTLTPEVRLTETEVTGGLTRRLTISTVLGKTVSASVLRQSPEGAKLRELALKYRAIAAAEPAWTTAGTELLITPEISGAALVIKVVPQIVLPAAAAGQTPRRIPISACAAGIMVARGAPAQTGILPGTDPEFYRLFLGAQQAQDDTFTSLTVSAQVQYLGSPPGAPVPR